MFNLKLEVTTFCCIFKSCIFSCHLKLWSLAIKTTFFNQTYTHQEKKNILDSILDSLIIPSDFKISVIVASLEINHFHHYSTMETFRWRAFLILMSSKHSWKLPIKDLIYSCYLPHSFSLMMASLILLSLIALLGWISHCPAGTVTLPSHFTYNLNWFDLNISMWWNLLWLWKVSSFVKSAP